MEIELDEKERLRLVVQENRATISKLQEELRALKQQLQLRELQADPKSLHSHDSSEHRVHRPPARE